MGTAVMRVVIDQDGELDPVAYELGVELLRGQGLTVIGAAAERLPVRAREIELIIDEVELGNRGDELLAACRDAFGIEPQPGVVTFISRGTDEDARGVLRRFNVEGRVSRSQGEEGDVIEVLFAADQRRSVPEGRLQTALEAALNEEVRIVFAE